MGKRSTLSWLVLSLVFLVGCAARQPSAGVRSSGKKFASLNQFFCPATNSYIPVGTVCGFNAVSPGPIGGTTPAAGTFTTLSATATGCVTPTVVICADQQSGADWSVKVAAAFTALGSTVGTVDARGFITNQTMSVNISVPAGDTLLWPCGVTVTRATGAQLIVTDHSTVQGCGTGGTASFLTSQMADTSNVIVQTPTNRNVDGIHIFNMRVDSFAAGSNAVYLVAPISSRFSNNTFNGGTAGVDIGELTGGCACYNVFDQDFVQGLTYGYVLGATSNGGYANQNQFIGGNGQGGTIGYYLKGGVHNTIYSGDSESCCSVAAYDIFQYENVIVNPYIESIGGVNAIFEAGLDDHSNLIIASQDFAANVTNNASSHSNCVIGADENAAGFETSLCNINLGYYGGGAITDLSTYNGLLLNDGGYGSGHRSNDGTSVAAGTNALNSLNGGSNSIALGNASCAAMVGNSDCIGIGNDALQQATGGGNTAVGGNLSCHNVVAGSGNSCFGYGSGPTGDFSNDLDLGIGATSSAGSRATIGGSGITDEYFGSETPTANLHAVSLILATGTFPTITGCGTISATAGGATVGTFTTNTTGTCTAAIPMPTAPHGWVCVVQDITKHVATNIMIQSATSTTSCTVTGTTAASDVLTFVATGY